MMKKIGIAVSVTLLLALGSFMLAQQHPSEAAVQNTQAPGRYQLFQANWRFQIEGNPLPVNQVGVFRIDTKTGVTWIFREGQLKDGTVYSRWQLIEEGLRKVSD